MENKNPHRIIFDLPGWEASATRGGRVRAGVRALAGEGIDAIRAEGGG